MSSRALVLLLFTTAGVACGGAIDTAGGPQKTQQRARRSGPRGWNGPGEVIPLPGHEPCSCVHRHVRITLCSRL
jgi:hypothetical protein